MATRDVRDIMGLPSVGSDAPKALAARKPKPQSALRQKGINRELIALHGERAPPVSIIDSGKQYRAKIHRDFKPSHWEHVAFANEARKDGLQLRHWRKRRPVLPVAVMTEEDGDTKGVDMDRTEKEYDFAKYDLDISVPSYTDEQYDAHLKSSKWSKEETDYLIDLVKAYHQRWALIIDRYDYKPSPSTDESTSQNGEVAEGIDSTALVKTTDPPPTRKLEDLKARFYKVWATSISLSVQGPQNMSEAEFSLHESLLKYNPSREETRKELVWQLAKRAADDVREEEFLLSELQRIMISAQKFEVERKEVRERLEMAQQTANGANNVFASASSSALNQLYAQLAAQDRNRKQRHRLSLNTGDASGGNAGTGPLTGNTPNTAAASAGGAAASARRDSVSGNATNAQRRGATAAAQPPSRTLSPRREARFGVSTHDRLTSGVSFRSDKLLKLRQAKSQIQTQKIAAALTELRVPEILVLPTTRVCDAFEGLVGRITKLVEARKVLEREESELRVKAQIKEEVANGKKEGGAGETKAPEGAGKEDEIEAEIDAEGEEDEDHDGDEKDKEENENEEEDDDEDEEDAEGEADSNPEGDVTALSQDADEDDNDAQDPDEDDAPAEVDDSEEEAEADADADEADEAEHAEDDPRPSSSRGNAVAGFKRGASVLSEASSKASRNSKRTRR